MSTIEGVAAASPRPLTRIALMSGAFAASNSARGAIALATSLVIARGMGLEAFGAWAFCTAWASTLTTTLDLGFGVLLTRDAARDRRVCQPLASAVAARMLAFLPVGGVFFVAAPLLTVAGVSSQTLRAAVPLALSGVTYGCFAAVFRAWPECLAGILTLESACAAVQCAASWMIIRWGGRTDALLWLATAVQTVQLLFLGAWLLVVRRPDDLAKRPSGRDVLSAVRRALPFAGIGLISTAQRRVPSLALGYLSGAGALAVFTVAWRMGNAVRTISSAAFAGGLPVFSEHASRGDLERIRSPFHRGITAFACVSAVALAVGSRWMIHWTYGDEFSNAVPVLVFIALGMVPAVMNGGRRVYLFADGKENAVLRWTSVTLAVQLASWLILIPLWGALGAAAGLVLGDLAVWGPLARA